MYSKGHLNRVEQRYHTFITIGKCTKGIFYNAKLHTGRSHIYTTNHMHAIIHIQVHVSLFVYCVDWQLNNIDKVYTSGCQH